jgi:hypothetical protein
VPPSLLDVLLRTFEDLRQASAAANTDDGRLESSLSTAEQIGVLEDAVLHSRFFGDAVVRPELVAASVVGTLVRRIPEDVSVMNRFWHSVIDKHASKEKGDWVGFLEGGKEALKQLG